MRVLFLVQGEGRGHLTQALSLQQILQTAGHEVVGALVGVANHRPVPAFFSEQFSAPIIPVESPALVYSQHTSALQPVKTVIHALRQAPRYRRSLQLVYEHITALKPDLVVNFYELLGGLTYAFYRLSVPMVCVAHQYLLFHPAFPLPSGKRLDVFALKLNSWLTAIGATELLALSFDQQMHVAAKRLRVVPPLLRQEITDRIPTKGAYFLAYTTQPGLVSRIRQAHRQRPDITIRCFHAGAKAAEERIDDTLTYHAIDGKRFLDTMQHCSAVVTTAGFESVCEALYMGKPVLMIPQPNHIEQTCNALDGERVGVGIASDSFDLNCLINYLPHHDPSVTDRFQAWYKQGYFIFLAALNRAVESKHKSAPHTGWTSLNRRLRLQ